MAQESLHSIRRFDQVSLLTTRNVTYISTDSEELPLPDGVWTVVSLLGDELLLTKDETVIKIPGRNVLKICDYDQTMKEVYSHLGSLRKNVERQERTDEQHTDRPPEVD